MHDKDPIDPSVRFMDGYEPAPLPPMSPDGTAVFTPAPVGELPQQPISLCRLGPCANYHEIRIKLDAQDPLDGSAGRVHLATLRTCYPHPGIEMDLKDTPVRECNRWHPVKTTEESNVHTTHAKAAADNFPGGRPGDWNDFLNSWNTNEET